MENTKQGKVRVGLVVDEDLTIIDEIFAGDRIQRGEQLKHPRKYVINFCSEEDFVKLIPSNLITLYKELTKNEFATMIVLASFVSFDDGILRIDDNGQRKILDTRTICDLLGEKYDTFRKVIASLIEKRILAKVERQSDTYANRTKQCIAVNPYIFFKGKDMEKDIVALFKKSKWAPKDTV